LFEAEKRKYRLPQKKGKYWVQRKSGKSCPQQKGVKYHPQQPEEKRKNTRKKCRKYKKKQLTEELDCVIVRKRDKVAGLFFMLKMMRVKNTWR
jgi:hypothetical protein